MRKSPFSTPRGNGNGRPGYGWKSAGSPARDYGRKKNFDFHSPNRSENSSQSIGDDFIPFASNTTPSSDRKTSGNWSSPNRGNWSSPSGGNWSSPNGGNWQSPGRGNHRQSMSPGFNNYRNNSGWENHRKSPYAKEQGNSFRGNRKSFQKFDTPRKFDISRYVNLGSFLEDPWAELSRKMRENGNFDDSTNENLSDLSFNSSILDIVRLDDSVDEENLRSADVGRRDEIDASYVESESCVSSARREIVATSSESSSSDLQTSQDSKD